MREIAPYERIASQLRDAITSGSYQAGDKLPSTRELVDHHNVAKATIDKAVKTLRTERLIRAEPGVGMIVTDHRRVNSPQEMFFRAAGLARDIRVPGEESQLLHVGWNQAPEEVAHVFDVNLNDRLGQRQRLIKQNNKPTMLATSWFPVDIVEACPKLIERERIPEGTATYIANTLGTNLETGVDVLEAQRSDTHIANLVSMPMDEPLLKIANRVMDPTGRILEYGGYHVFEGTQVSYSYEVPHTNGNGEATA